MEVVYLGLVEKVFNAIFNAILSPVFKFIASLLETVLSWLFEVILEPLLVTVFQPLFISLVKMVYQILSSIFYSVFCSFLKLIDSMQLAFEVFAGVKPVTYSGKSMTLLEVLFRQHAIQQAMWVLIGVSVALMFMFAVMGTLRSMMDLSGELQRPVSKVLSSTLRAFAKMILIPAVSLFAILMSGQILTSVNGAIGGENAKLSSMVFVVSSMDASRQKEYNVSGKTSDDEDAPKASQIGDIGIGDPVRGPYYNGEKDYTNKDVVEKDFIFSRFDYLIGYGGCAFLIIVLAICMMTFITRIFEVVILLLIAPFFASVMPLDDGEKFKAWQEMFVAKLFSGYGTVVAMQLYMILCPAIMNGKIIFGQNATAEANYLIRFVFLLGGAWATVKAGPTITQLLNFQAGAAEADTARTATAAVYGTAAFAGSALKGAARFAGGTIRNAYQGHQQKKAFEKQDKKAHKEAEAYRLDGMRGKPQGSFKPSSGGSGGGSGEDGGGKAALAGAAVQGAKIVGTGLKKIGTSASGKAKRLHSILGGHITLNQSESGKKYLGVDFGSFMNFGRDEQGNYHAKVFGMGLTESADGKNRKIQVPFVKMKNDQVTGKMRVSSVSALGFKSKRAAVVGTDENGEKVRSYGNMYFSDASCIGYSRRFDQATGQVERKSILGAHYERGENGEYYKSSQNVLGIVNSTYRQDAFGQSEVTSRKVSTVLGDADFSYDIYGKRHLENIRAHKSDISEGRYLYRNDKN